MNGSRNAMPEARDGTLDSRRRRVEDGKRRAPVLFQRGGHPYWYSRGEEEGDCTGTPVVLSNVAQRE